MIEFQIGGRKTGKTTLLLEWMKDKPNAVYIGATIDMCNNAYERAISMGIKVDKSQFVSYHQVQHGILKGRNCVICVDNLDHVLYHIFGDNVERITATGIDILRDY